MKKINLFCAALALLGGLALSSCDKADNAIVDPGTGTISALETYYFSVESATYINTPFPASTTEETIQGLNFNPYAIKGGTGTISVTTNLKYNKFFVGAKEVQDAGYFQFIPVTEQGGEGGEALTNLQLYKIALLYSTLLDKEITVLISAEKEDGTITKPLEYKISFVDSFSGTGEIDINLSFDQHKDVDLHLYTPSGKHIYFGDRGFTWIDEETGEEKRYGLDIDSYASCNDAGNGNENIVIPVEYLENGTYTVQIDMWSNCSPRENPTNCIITARYKNQFLTNIIDNELFAGKNPIYFTYATNCGNGDHTNIMKFTITDAPEQPQAAPLRAKRYVPSIIDEMKMEEETWK